MTSDTLAGERFRLALDRIREIQQEAETAPQYVPWFRETAKWILFLLEERRALEDGSFGERSPEELAAANRAMYADILPEHYGTSPANPVRSVRLFGKGHGQVMAALRYELRGMIPLAFAGDAERFLIRMELLLEVYFAFVNAWHEKTADEEDGSGGHMTFSEQAASPEQAEKKIRHKNRAAETDGIPPAGHIREKIRQYLIDYAEEETRAYLAQCTAVGRAIPGRAAGGSADGNFPNGAAADDASCKQGAVSAFAPEDPRSLYCRGLYIADAERDAFEYLQRQDEDTVMEMANRWTEDFCAGCGNEKKRPPEQKNVFLCWPAGFERVAAYAAANLRKAGFTVMVPGTQTDLFTQHLGIESVQIPAVSPNPQYEHDHSEDLALFFNDVLRTRRRQALEGTLQALQEAYACCAGTVRIEGPAERPFAPVTHPECPRFTPSQHKKIDQAKHEAELLFRKVTAEG